VVEVANIKADIKNNQILLVEVANAKYSEELVTLSKLLSSLGNVLYVSINRPYNSLLTLFSQHKIKTDKFFFVDAVTKTAKPSKDLKNVKFISGPGALTELSLSIFASVESHDFYSMLFDSLSTLLIYENSLMITKFVHNLTSRFRTLKTKAILVIVKEGIGSELVKDLSMFVDKIIRLGG